MCCGPSLEPSRWDGSNERSQHIFSLRNKKKSLNYPQYPLLSRALGYDSDSDNDRNLRTMMMLMVFDNTFSGETTLLFAVLPPISKGISFFKLKNFLLLKPSILSLGLAYRGPQLVVFFSWSISMVCLTSQPLQVPRLLKKSMLNAAAHEILNAHKHENIKKVSFLQAQISLECIFTCS